MLWVGMVCCTHLSPPQILAGPEGYSFSDVLSEINPPGWATQNTGEKGEKEVQIFGDFSSPPAKAGVSLTLRVMPP